MVATSQPAVMGSPKAPPAPRNQKPVLAIIFLLLIAALFLVNQAIYRNISNKLTAKRPSYALAEFVNDIKSGNMDAAYALTTARFKKTDAPQTKKGAQSVSEATVSKATFMSLKSSPAFSVLDNPFTIYQDPLHKDDASNAYEVARFTDSSGRNLDMYVKLSKESGNWRVDSFNLPDNQDL